MQFLKLIFILFRFCNDRRLQSCTLQPLWEEDSLKTNADCKSLLQSTTKFPLFFTEILQYRTIKAFPGEIIQLRRIFLSAFVFSWKWTRLFHFMLKISVYSHNSCPFSWVSNFVKCMNLFIVKCFNTAYRVHVCDKNQQMNTPHTYYVWYE